jgi:hypothetical protein
MEMIFFGSGQKKRLFFGTKFRAKSFTFTNLGIIICNFICAEADKFGLKERSVRPFDNNTMSGLNRPDLIDQPFSIGSQNYMLGRVL